jgi:hypothetical protein
MKFELNGVQLDLDKETVQGMLKKFDAPASRRFKPEIGDNYWRLSGSGVCNMEKHGGEDYDLGCIARGNCYRTRQDAIKADDLQRKIVKLNDMIDDFNGDWVADWTDETQKKYELVYNHNRKEIDTAIAHTQQGYLLVKYVKSGIDTLPTEIKNLFTEISEAING